MSSKVTLSKELHSIILFCLYSCTNNDPKIYNHCYTAYTDESYFYNHKNNENYTNTDDDNNENAANKGNIHSSSYSNADDILNSINTESTKCIHFI